MKRVLRWIRQLLRREAPYTPLRRTGLMYDPEFVRQSFRTGERVDPIAATVEE
jgi:hypothetical protein